MLRTRSFTAIFLLSTIACSSATAAKKGSPDYSHIYAHVQKTFNTPAKFKMRIFDLKPSPIKGMLSGQFEISDGNNKQVQPIQLTEDGRYYVLSDWFKMGASVFPSLKSPQKKGKVSPPMLHLSPDGKHILYGQAQDASVDPEQEIISKIDLKNALGVGPKDAPVTLVEFSEVQCPYCKKAHAIFEEVLKGPEYAGKVRWVFKHYPLVSMHPWAYDASVAIACVGKIAPKKRQDMIGKFYNAQKSITKANLSAKSLEFAKALAVSEPRFKKCLAGKEGKAQVDKDIKEGNSLGVEATPSIFINGRRLRNYYPQELRRLLDEKLAESKR